MRTVVCVCGWYSSGERANGPNHGRQADGSCYVRGYQRHEGMNPEVVVDRCGALIRPFSRRRVQQSGTSWGVSNQSRVYPA